MRSILKLVAAALAVASLALVGMPGCAREPRSPSRVLVFGIDGGTWDVIEAMFEDGELPNLKRLYDSGVHGVLESRPPVLSPVVWSTIFTGRPWQEHGVRDWKTSQSVHRKVKTVWEIATDAELESIVLNVPSSWPVTEIKGAMVAGFPLSGSTVGGNTGEVVGRNELGRKGLQPVYALNAPKISAAMEKLQVGEWSDWIQVEVRGRPKWRAMMRVLHFEKDRFYLTPVYRDDDELVITYPASLRAELAEQINSPYIPEGPGWSRHAEPDTPKVLFEHLRQVADIQTKAAEILVKRPWDLFIFIDTLVDRVSHPYWAYMRPDDYKNLDAAKAARFAETVRDAYRDTDEHLGRVLSEVDGPHWVVIASDHGFRSNRDDALHIGTHDFDGIYLVSGPDVEPAEGSRAYIEDIAPTVLYLLGKPVASDMTGKVIPDVADLVARPIEQVASYEGGTATARGTDAPVDEKTWEQLKGLGYVEGDAPAPAAPAAKAAARQPAARKPPAKKPPVKQAPKQGAMQKAPKAAPKPPQAAAPKDDETIAAGDAQSPTPPGP